MNTEEKPKYDFETPIEQTSTNLAKFIISKLSENADDLIFQKKTLVAPYPPRPVMAPVDEDTSKFTPEQLESYNAIHQQDLDHYTSAKTAYDEAMTKYTADKVQYDADVAEENRKMEVGLDVSIAIFQEISKSDITIPYATRCIDKIQIVLGSIQKYIDGSISQQRHEYASRSLGVKAPDSGKYTEECAPVGLLAIKLQEVRDSQGNKKSDYFFGTGLEEKENEVPTTDLSTDKSNVAEKTS